jgi:tetratricopeptide (TPR) repeat protein
LKLVALVAAAVLLTAAGAQAQAWRGTGRLAGKVIDDSGAPIQGVAVKLFLVGEQEGTTVKTNKKGEWAANGIAAGQWQIDFTKDGYLTRKISASLGFGERQPPIETTLQTAPPNPNDVIHDQLVKAAGLMHDEKYADARKIYEDLEAQFPQVHQFLPLIARTYVAEKNYPKAIESLEEALKNEPDNLDLKMLLADTYAKNGQQAESDKITATIDTSQIKDPATLLNLGIAQMNEKKADEALSYFDKTVTQFPDYPDGYYYRGITNLQLGHEDQAKTDLQKFVQMAPNAPEAETAKKLLEQLGSGGR